MRGFRHHGVSISAEDALAAVRERDDVVAPTVHAVAGSKTTIMGRLQAGFRP